MCCQSHLTTHEACHFLPLTPPPTNGTLSQGKGIGESLQRKLHWIWRKTIWGPTLFLDHQSHLPIPPGISGQRTWLVPSSHVSRPAPLFALWCLWLWGWLLHRCCALWEWGYYTNIKMRNPCLYAYWVISSWLLAANESGARGGQGGMSCWRNFPILNLFRIIMGLYLKDHLLTLAPCLILRLVF